MITVEFGEVIAALVGNAHEENPFAIDGIDSNSLQSFSTLSEADETIDLLNNIIGRSIGAGFEGTTRDLAVLVLNYYHDYGLWVATLQSDGTYKVVQQKLNDNEYTTAYNKLMQLNNYGFTEEGWAKAAEFWVRNR